MQNQWSEKWISLVSLSLILFFIGCSGKDIYPDIIDSFKVNRTTINTVRISLGEPYQKKLDPDGNEVWVYQYYDRYVSGWDFREDKTDDPDWRSNPDFSRDKWDTALLILTFHEDILINLKKTYP